MSASGRVHAVRGGVRPGLPHPGQAGVPVAERRAAISASVASMLLANALLPGGPGQRQRLEQRRPAAS